MHNRLPAVTVVGSINVDLIATAERLPTAGETIGDAVLSRQPGGKGANQAAALARLGGNARMVGAVGNDDSGRQMLDALSAAGVGTGGVSVLPQATGTALISVDNPASSRVAEKVRYTFEGVLRSVHHRDEDRVDLQSWSLLPGELPGSPGGAA